jgi:uncharacterized protein (DUF433 family)
MSTKRLLSIVSAPGVCGGDPVFEGSRLQPKQIIYRLIYEPESLFKDYPYIEQDLRTLLDIIDAVYEIALLRNLASISTDGRNIR